MRKEKKTYVIPFTYRYLHCVLTKPRSRSLVFILAKPKYLNIVYIEYSQKSM